jgi:hypothetical protein
MKKQYPKIRRIKIALRKLELELGNFLQSSEFDSECPDSNGKLDFWVSYYVTWLLRKLNFPKEAWCDGVAWRNGIYILEFSRISERRFELKSEIDILEYSEASNSKFLLNFEYSNNFEKFKNYIIHLNIGEKQYLFMS